MQAAATWTVLQDRICRRCVDGDGTGACRLPAGEACALQHFLPEIIATVSATTATTIDGYIERLRSGICAHCDSQNADLVCSKRNHLECALDRYYPLVIEIIEQVRRDGGAVHAA